MALTRSASSSPVKKTAKTVKTAKKPNPTVHTVSTAPKLVQGQPLRVMIAPKAISVAARFVTLANPIDQGPKRYLFCPENGVYELICTSAPKHDPRSILFTPDEAQSSEKPSSEAISNGYVNRVAEHLTATSYDLCYNLIPLITGSSKSNLFQTLDDIFDTSDTNLYDLPYLFQKSRPLLEKSLLRVCDIVEAGDETLYRFSQSKTLQLILARAKRGCEKGLPASLEDRFVTRVLETPMLSVKREEDSAPIIKTESFDGSAEPCTGSESLDSQSTATSTVPSVVFSETSTASSSNATTTVSTTTVSASVLTHDPPTEVVTLQRLLTAFKFIVHSYLPPLLAEALLKAVQDSSSDVDFSPLTKHLAYLADLRAQAIASQDLCSFSRKRGIEDDDEAEERAEKKRRHEEEEKRKKASQSRGVKELAKVDVKGMKKMSAFFTEVPPKGKG